MSEDGGQDSHALESEVAVWRARAGDLESQVESLRHQEDALRRKEQVLHATLDSADDGILAVGDDGKVIFANRAFAKMWRIPPDLMDAADDNELLKFVLDQLGNPEAFLTKVRELYASYRTSNDTLIFKDGRVFQRTSQPLVVNDVLCGRVWTFRDKSPIGAVKHHIYR